MTMKKKEYLSPRMKVRKVRAQQMLCGSLETFGNEGLDEVYYDDAGFQ